MRVALILALAAGLAQPIAASSAESGASARPDETALRYYAQQKQTDRVAAESERLRRRFPSWQPPTDLWTAEPGGEDEGSLWDLYGAGRNAELSAAIAERTRAEPDWKPSPALSRAVAQRMLGLEAQSLVKAMRWMDLAKLADSHLTELGASDSDLVLAVAEAWGRTERGSEAFALLQRLMQAPRFGAGERRVAVLRAMAFLSMGEVDRLVALGKPGDFDDIRVDLIRGRISAVLHDEAGQSISEADLKTFETHAETAADPNQPGLVAWYAYKRHDFPTALDWFKKAISRGGDAMVAHGLAHTLRQLGFRREAEDVAYAWREPLVNNSLLFIDLLETELTREVPPAIKPERLRRYAQVTAATASGEGAQALAWYAYNNCQFETALDWFKRGVAWFPKEATVYGYALTLRRLKQQRTFIEVVNRYDGLFPKVVDLLFEPRRDHPTPCDLDGARLAIQRARPERDSVYLQLKRLDITQVGLSRRVPGPDESDAGEAELPRIRRSDFPIAVLMENDLRVAPTRREGSLATDLRWPSRAIGRAPIVARRVPGVGPMPYERYGFTLKSSFDGKTEPSSPTAAEQPAPLGTLWSDETQGTSPELGQPKPVNPEPASRDETVTTGSIRSLRKIAP